MLKLLVCTIPLLLASGSVSSQVIDTLGLHDFNGGTVALYESPNGGFTFGNNGYGDRSKVQIFLPEHPLFLQKVLLKFGSVTYASNNPASVVRVNVYLLNGPGITTIGNVTNGAPDSVLAFVDVPVSSINGSGAVTEVDFSLTDLNITGWFGVGIDVTDLAAGDTVGLLSTTDGDGGQRQRCWELEASGTWITVLSQFSWALDVDLAIFPVVESSATSVEAVDGWTDLVYPNPSDGRFAVELNGPSNSEVTIFSLDGKILTQSQVERTLQFDISDQPAGMYIMRISDAHSTRIRKIIVR
jgi:hypothetical protein